MIVFLFYLIFQIKCLTRLEQPKISDMKRQIMAKLFHNNLHSQYSYIGQKKKNRYFLYYVHVH